MAEKGSSDESATATQPSEAEQKAAAEAQAKYDGMKTGDPIGDADLRAQLGVPTTAAEEDKLTEQQVELMTSSNVLARERFEQSATEGAPSPGQAEAVAKFQDDMSSATIDRDPKAYVDARAAMGLKTTDEDLRKFEHPTLTDLYGAERQAALTGLEVPDDSKLATQHTALQDEMNKAYIDRDPAAFVQSREMQGLPTSPADMAAFTNPSPSDILGMARNDALLGIDVPDGSALAQQVSNVLGGKMPGNVAPTQTQGQGQSGTATTTGPGGGSQQPGSSTGTGGPGGSGGSGTTAADRMDFAAGTGGSHDTPTGAGTGDAQASSPSAPGADVGAGTPGATPGGAPSAVDAAAAALHADAPAEAEIPSSRGTGSAGSTNDLGWPGGVGTQNNGVPAGGSGGAGAAGAGGTPDPLDDSGEGMTTVGGQQTGSDGGVTTDLPGGGTSTTYPDGTTSFHDAAGNLTGTMTGADYEATKQGSESASAGTGTSGGTDDGSGDDGSGDDGSGDDGSGDDGSGDDGSGDDGSGDDSTDTGGDDSGTETAMTNPDDATTLTGLAAGLVDPLGMSSNTIYGSSTHGGATDTGRGDLDNGGGGGATGELNGKLTAGPETNPDEATVNDGTLVDQYHKGDGIGTVDGVRPDLAGDGLGPIGPPVDDGVTPYAAGIGDASGGTSGTATGGALGGHHDVAGSLSSEVHVDGISAEHADLNPGIGMALSPNADDHGDMGFGGPGDDGLG